MANGITFDTHEFVTELTRAKMPPRQAEVLAKTYANLLNEQIATKKDLELLEARLWAKVLGLHVATAGTMTAIILAALRFWT